MLAIRARAVPASAPRLRQRLPTPAAVHRVRYYAVVASAATPQKSKVWDSVDEAIKDVKSGDILLSGGEFILPRMSLHAQVFALEELD